MDIYLSPDEFTDECLNIISIFIIFCFPESRLWGIVEKINFPELLPRKITLTIVLDQIASYDLCIMAGNPMRWATFYFVAEVANAFCSMIREFQVLESPPGSKLCALDAPSDSVTLNSTLECALQCQRFWYCENFNYNNVSNVCDIFYNRPKCFGPLSLCTHYQVAYSAKIIH